MWNLNGNNWFFDPQIHEYHLVNVGEWLMWEFMFLYTNILSRHKKILPHTLWRCWDIGKLVGEHKTTTAVGSICEKFNINFVTFKHYWYWWYSSTRSFLLSTFTADTQFVIYTRTRIYVVQIKHKKKWKRNWYSVYCGTNFSKKEIALTTLKIKIFSKLVHVNLAHLNV